MWDTETAKSALAVILHILYLWPLVVYEVWSLARGKRCLRVTAKEASVLLSASSEYAHVRVVHTAGAHKVKKVSQPQSKAMGICSRGEQMGPACGTISGPFHPVAGRLLLKFLSAATTASEEVNVRTF